MLFQFRKLFAAGTAAVMLLSGMTFFQTTASAEGTMTADDITENMTIGTLATLWIPPDTAVKPAGAIPELRRN